MPETVVTAASSDGKTITIDHTHPYYLGSSDSPGMTLVNTVFDGKGYLGWRRSILLSLSTKKKLGFINGSCKSPDPTLADFEQWNCCNDMVLSWILNALSKEIADSVMSSTTAKGLWDSMEQRFGKSNGAKLYHLQKELFVLVQGNSDIAGYFTKIKRIWDELDSLSKGKHSYENQREVYANAQFSADSASFTAMGQGKFANNQLMVEFAAFMAARQARNAQKFKFQPQRGRDMNQKFNNSAQRFVRPQKKFKGKKKYNPNATCTYCGKTGHVMDDCYRLIGFPQDFEFTKGQDQPRANGIISTEGEGDKGIQYVESKETDITQQYTKEEVAEMMHMYKHAKQAQKGINANAIAGTVLKYSRSCFASLTSSTWIIDSGASEHMCYNPNSFMFLIPLLVPLNISLPNSFKFTCDILFTSSSYILQGLSKMSPQAFGEVREGLYLLEPSSPKSRCLFTSDVVSIPKGSNSIQESVSVPSSVNVNSIPNFKVKVKMIRSDNALELGKGTQEAAYLASEGIIHQVSCVATPQQK
ncbi:uncharacterized protein LOC132619384 [Lycium barbarum]|uniref:uncharacterized protein LOC132619384 n=1 Tax=Lycium barbarum TaxID=112863 RepID=UPI00293E15E3|nr:uncharacterized protein LOC132619384 [Lycium barbarum]